MKRLRGRSYLADWAMLSASVATIVAILAQIGFRPGDLQTMAVWLGGEGQHPGRMLMSRPAGTPTALQPVQWAINPPERHAMREAQ
jgi:hypothetical protein